VMLGDMNSVNTKDCRELHVSCCCVRRFRMAGVLRRLEPAAISGNTSELPHFVVYLFMFYFTSRYLRCLARIFAILNSIGTCCEF